MGRILSKLFLLVLLFSSAIAQDRTVKGTVTAIEDGFPLPGVSVKVKGTNLGTQTGGDGQFSIKVSIKNAVLVFTYIGYRTEELSVGSKTQVTVALTADSKQLGEVVVTGYGTQRRTSFTGAASSVSGEDIAARPVQSFTQALSGKASGVNIVQPNGVLNNPPVVRIRGVNSISLSSFPLVVIDGIPISTTDISSNSSANNPLADIDPNDIETIDVLKDAASTSVYGSRGANGVLIITTKSGKKGSTKVTYNGWVGVSKVTRLPDLLNAQQYIDYKNEAVANYLVNVPTATTATLPRDANNKSFFPSYKEDGSLVETNWYDIVYRDALSQNHTMSFSGGSDNTTYYLSLGLSNQDGFIKTNSFDRKNARMNLSHKVTNWLTARSNITYSNSKNAAPNTGSISGQAYNSSGLARLALGLPPNVAARNADGSYNINASTNTIGSGANLVAQTWQNPLPLLDLNTQTSENNRIIANIGADVTLLKGLTFKTTYSLDNINAENILFYNPIHGDGFSTSGTATNRNDKRDNWNWVNSLQYQTAFAEKHNVSVSVISDVQKTNLTTWGATRTSLSDLAFDEYQAGFITTNASGNTIGKRSYQSYIVSANYNFANKYFISGNYNRNGNSALAAGRKWGDFGGLSAGWTLSEEAFFKNSLLSNTISSLKLRGSWGKVGNGNLNSDFGSYSTYSTGNYGDQSTLIYSQAGNQLLSWETSKQTNVGLDLGLLHDRITFVANYYYNNIDQLILDAPQAPSKGIPNLTKSNVILTNVGAMYNKGLEFSLNANVIKRAGFSWNSNFNITLNKNRVTKLAGDNTPIVGQTSGTENTNITRVGNSVGSLFVVETAGINPENGRRIFVNKSGKQVQYNHGVTNPWTYLDGSTATAVTGADATVVKNAIPTWYGGFTNTFTYKNFDLNLLLTYQGGNYIYNGTQSGLRDQRVWNNHTDVLRRWTSPGQVTDIPRAVYLDNVSNGSSIPLDINVEKGDFLRLQNAALGYRLPARLFGRSGITSLRVYGQVDNAFLITKYSGSDPEISSNGQSNISPGVERNTVPQGRVFTFGVNLGF